MDRATRVRRTAALVATALFMATGAARAGELRGSVRFSGDKAPEAKRLRLDADPKCKAAHPGGMDDDHFRIDARRGVADAVVYIRSGLPEGQKYPAPEAPVTLDQIGCRYVPKVFGVQTGQRLRIVNSDDTLHNVHAVPRRNPGFNIGMPVKGMVNDSKSFPNPEVAVRIKCDVHPWMAAYAAVLPHPYFAVTDADGAYEIRNLPAGTYIVEVWHSRLGRERVEGVRVETEGSFFRDFNLGSGK